MRDPLYIDHPNKFIVSHGNVMQTALGASALAVRDDGDGDY